MPSKLQPITKLYNDTIKSITQSPEDWQRFLQAAAHNYKLPFDEQLLVYAQRPDATAVLDMHRWNRNFGRYVNAGSTGIAVFDRSSSRARLKYYFDITDTHETLLAQPVPLWEVQPEYEQDIIEALDNSFGEPGANTSLSSALFSAADNLTIDNLPDYYDQLKEMGVEIDSTAYFLAVRNSVAYMLLSRCGEDAGGFKFDSLLKFDTLAAVNSLGGATSAIAEMGLREIAATVLSTQKNLARTFDGQPEAVYNETIPADERTENYGRHNLHDREQLSGARPSPAAADRGRFGQVREDAVGAPAEEQASAAHAHDDPGHTLGAPAGDPAYRGRADGTADRAEGGGAGRGRGAQSQRPDAVAGQDEQHPGQRGRAGDEGAYLQLSLFFPTPEEQIEQIEEAGAVKTAAFSVSMEELDQELARGSGVSGGKYRVYEHFIESHTPEENARFLQDEFGMGGHSPVGDSTLNVWHDAKGLRFSDGYLDAKGHTFSWRVVAQRISDLVALERYLTPEDRERYPIYQAGQEQLAARRTTMRYIESMSQLSLTEKRDTLALRLADYLNILEGYEKAYLVQHGLEVPDDTTARQVGDLLQSTRQAQQLLDALADIQGHTADVFTRKHAWLFGGELRELLPMVYVYQPGDRVYIDTVAYTVQSFDDSVVRLSDPQFPLKPVEYARDVFDRELAGDIQNDRLLRVVLDTAEAPAAPAKDVDDVFKRTYTDTQRESARVTAPARTPKTTAQSNYDFLNQIAPEILSGEATYLRFTAGESFMPLSMDLLGDGRLAISHYYEQNSDQMADPDMEFVFDREAGTLAARTYQQDGLGVFQRVEDDGGRVNTALERQLNSFARDWFRNIRGQGYRREVMEVPYRDDALELVYGEDGQVVFINGEVSLAAAYACAHGIVLPAEEKIPTMPRELYQTYLPMIVGEIRQGSIYRRMRDRDLEVAEAEALIGEWLDAAALDEETYPGLGEALGLPMFREWLVEDILDETYQNVVLDTRSHLEQNELNSDAPDWAKRLPDHPPVLDEWDEPADDDNALEQFGEPFDDASPVPVPELPRIGDRYEIQGRRYVVDSIGTYNVSLRDVTFEDGTGFPIFKSESLDFLRMYDPIPEAMGTVVSRKIIDGSLFDIELVQHHIPGPEDECRNFRITDDDLGHGGAKAKYKANAEALRLLKDLEFDQRLATPAEQEILSRYVGWGSLPQAFDPDNQQWEEEYLELNALLTPEKFAAARASTLNAHYTSPTVIKAMYKAVENMGFTTGNVLEPSCGIGNFFGLVPESMSESRLYGVELDPVTGRIAQQLYQNNNIVIQGFEHAELPDSFFDLAIGNVPFGEYSVHDRRYDKHHFHIHDYFFAKALDKVRPGGIIAFITSKYTMDKQNPAVRKYIAQHAELLGAIRLPNNAFKANAGTEVTADIIFLQKRDRMIDIDPDWVHLGQADNGITVNSYFAEHPEMMLGTMSVESTQYGYDTTCQPFPDRDLADLLDRAAQSIHAEIPDYERDEPRRDFALEEESIPADPDVRNYSYTIVKGKVYYRENSRMVPQELSATARSRVKGMIEIRDCARKLIELQTENAPDDIIQREQASLNRLYDNYTAKYGLLNDRANATVFREDGSYPLLCSLEVLHEDRNLKAKADMFSKRTIRPHAPITHVDTAAEALTVSLGERARVDLDFMSQLTGLEHERLITDLEGVIFRLPNTAAPIQYVTADDYLSGNVREKLAQARAAQAALSDGSFDGNVRALEAAQPTDLTASEISVRLGATWVPPDVVKQFMFELLETGYWEKKSIQVHYSQYTADWSVTGKGMDKGNLAAEVTYGTKRLNAYYIIEATLNLRTVRVFDKEEGPDGKEKRVLNVRKTAIAQEKQEIIKAKFVEWIWDDPRRRDWLCGIYNSLCNATRPRTYDGAHLRFPGMNPEIRLDAHQVNAIARHLYGGNALFGHVVGAGKTYTMIAAAMEAKRLGLCHKAMFVVPNNIVGQFAAEFMQLYPSANVLMVTEKDFEKRNRRKFCARIATGDYDGIVIAHSQFEKISMSEAWQDRFIRDQIRDITNGIIEMKEQKGERVAIKAMERVKASLQTRLQKLHDRSRKDDVLSFEELGIDLIFVDEADCFKNLAFVSKMRNVAGISQGDAQKASDLFMKCRYLDAQTGGRGVVFATGTPVSNTMAEMYTMQRYLQYEALVARGLEHFDCWASTFGETVTAMELAPEGTGFRMKTRFSRFYNLPELMNMFREVADIQTADMLNLPTPKVRFHVVAAKPSEEQREMVQELAARAEKIRNREVNPKEDNMLLVTNDGRKLALDQRLANPLLPDFAVSKVNLCVENALRIWRDTTDKHLAQLVFIDLSTPKSGSPRSPQALWGDNDGVEFDVYHDIKEKLLLQGVPADEIAFIHDAKNEAQKQALFGRVRSGQVRILLGSTAKMGAGTNVQDLLIAIHDCDCPWRPRDLEQRAGRLVRRGNTNPEVEIYRYVTEGTFDSYLYQIIENKQRFISQVFTSKSPARVMQDVDEAVLNFAEVKAIASGDPRIMKLCNLEAEVSKLRVLKSSHMSQRYEMEDKLRQNYPREIYRLEELVKRYTADAAHLTGNPPGEFSIELDGQVYTERKAAGSALLELCKATTGKDFIPIGHYRGFKVELAFDYHEKVHKTTLGHHGWHTTTLGSDIFGNLTRIDNVLDGIPARLKRFEDSLSDTRAQAEKAAGEAAAPFSREQELTEKSGRLAELKVDLQVDQPEPVLLADDAPDEGEAAAWTPQRKKQEMVL